MSNEKLIFLNALIFFIILILKIYVVQILFEISLSLLSLAFWSTQSLYDFKSIYVEKYLLVTNLTCMLLHVLHYRNKQFAVVQLLIM